METARAGIFYERETQPRTGHYASQGQQKRQRGPTNSTSNRGTLPQVRVSADVAVVNTTSRTILTQVFSNYTDTTIERAAYCFPLYHFSIITSFCCWHGGEIIKSTVKPKGKAKIEFQEAIIHNHATVLLEEHTSEVFETEIGNILPGADVKVEITYLTELKPDLGGHGVLVTIPTSIAERYGNLPESYTGSLTATARTKLELGMKIQVNVTMPVPIRSLESRSHPISVELGSAGGSISAGSFSELAQSSSQAKFDTKKARATLSSKNATLQKDFVLVISVAPSDDTYIPNLLAPRAILETSSHLSEFMAIQLAFTPRDLCHSQNIVAPPNMEIVILADRSGSMESKMNSLRRAIDMFLSNIPAGCLFNICSFGTSYSSLWTQSRPLNEANLKVAKQHVAKFEGDMGGTDILNALYQTASGTRSSSSTQVVVFTDGEVWDCPSVINYVRSTKAKYGDALRFFALGIGDEVSHPLIEGIGKQGGGYSEVVADDSASDWDDRVCRMLSGIVTPSDWKFKFALKDRHGRLHSGSGFSLRKHISNDNPCLMQLPHFVPIVNGFSRTIIYFILDKSAVDYLAVSVEGVSSDGKKIIVDVPIEQVHVSEPTHHILAAKALLNDLETGYSWLHDWTQTSSTSNKVSTKLQHEVIQEAEHVGIKWGLSGKWTSFIGVSTLNTTELSSRSYHYRHDRRELAELTRPRNRNSFADDQATLFKLKEDARKKRIKDDESKCNQMSTRRRDDYGEDDDDSNGPNSGFGGGDGSNGSGTAGGRGGASGEGSENARRDNAGATSGKKTGGASDASETTLLVDDFIEQQDNDGIFFSGTETTSHNANQAFTKVLKMFRDGLTRVLERLLQGLDCFLRLHMCRTIISVTYLRRAFPDSSKCQLAVERAERWVRRVVTNRVIRNKLTKIAAEHWIGKEACHLDLEDTEGAIPLIGRKWSGTAPCNNNVAIEVNLLTSLGPVDIAKPAGCIAELVPDTQFFREIQFGSSTEPRSDEEQLRSHSPPPNLRSHHDRRNYSPPPIARPPQYTPSQYAQPPYVVDQHYTTAPTTAYNPRVYADSAGSYDTYTHYLPQQTYATAQYNYPQRPTQDSYRQPAAPQPRIGNAAPSSTAAPGYYIASDGRQYTLSSQQSAGSQTPNTNRQPEAR